MYVHVRIHCILQRKPLFRHVTWCQSHLLATPWRWLQWRHRPGQEWANPDMLQCVQYGRLQQRKLCAQYQLLCVYFKCNFAVYQQVGIWLLTSLGGGVEAVMETKCILTCPRRMGKYKCSPHPSTVFTMSEFMAISIRATCMWHVFLSHHNAPPYAVECTLAGWTTPSSLSTMCDPIMSPVMCTVL